jgi:DNA-nicking Smr family endonuclease
MQDWTERRAETEFDLHGQAAAEAIVNAERFLQAQARARPRAVIRIITGRGRAGGGAPIRTGVRTLLRRLKQEQRLVRDYLLEESEGSFLIRLL